MKREYTVTIHQVSPYWLSRSKAALVRMVADQTLQLTAYQREMLYSAIHLMDAATDDIDRQQEEQKQEN